MILLVIWIILLFCVVITNIIATKSDPTAPEIIAERAYKKIRTNSMSAHSQVKHSFMCTHCDTSVSGDTKHCRSCGRCVKDFDHHCNAINNDVGGLNYHKFACMIGSYWIFNTF